MLHDESLFAKGVAVAALKTVKAWSKPIIETLESMFEAIRVANKALAVFNKVESGEPTVVAWPEGSECSHNVMLVKEDFR